MKKIRNVSILGAGLMGHGIALTFAKYGCNVDVYDPIEESLSSLYERVRTSLAGLSVDSNTIDEIIPLISKHSILSDAVRRADIVFEAGPEKLDIKQGLFSSAEKFAPEHCLFATNSSVISITKIAKDIVDKTRALGTHWWNPAHVIPLVEVIRTNETSSEAVTTVQELLESVGKMPVIVEKDIPGYIGNRLQHALWREAISLVENGVCSSEAVDTVIKSSFGRRLSVMGPLETADLVGTDLTLDIHENIIFDLESINGPSPYLRELVSSGKLGMKSGEGFRKWQPGDSDRSKAKLNKFLRDLDAIIP